MGLMTTESWSKGDGDVRSNNGNRRRNRCAVKRKSLLAREFEAFGKAIARVVCCLLRFWYFAPAFPRSVPVLRIQTGFLVCPARVNLCLHCADFYLFTPNAQNRPRIWGRGLDIWKPQPSFTYSSAHHLRFI